MGPVRQPRTNDVPPGSDPTGQKDAAGEGADPALDRIIPVLRLGGRFQSCRSDDRTDW